MSINKLNLPMSPKVHDAIRVECITRIHSGDDPIQEVKLRGDISDMTFTNDNFLKTFYEAIGTNIIEGVDLPGLGVRMWLDEEGKLKNDTPLNIDGTLLFQMEHKINDQILGNIVFTSIRISKDGYTEGLNKREKKKLLEVLEMLQSLRPEFGYMTEVLNG